MRCLCGLLTVHATRAVLANTRLLVNPSLEGDEVLAVLLCKLPFVPKLGKPVRDGTNQLYACCESSAPVTVSCPRTWSGVTVATLALRWPRWPPCHGRCPSAFPFSLGTPWTAPELRLRDGQQRGKEEKPQYCLWLLVASHTAVSG